MENAEILECPNPECPMEEFRILDGFYPFCPVCKTQLEVKDGEVEA